MSFGAGSSTPISSARWSNCGRRDRLPLPVQGGHVTTTAEALAEPRATRTPARAWAPLVALPLPDSLVRWGVLAGIIAFVAWSIEFLEVDLERLIGVFPRLGTLLASRYYPPDLGYLLASDFLRSVVQTLQMSLLGVGSLSR